MLLEKTNPKKNLSKNKIWDIDSNYDTLSSFHRNMNSIFDGFLLGRMGRNLKYFTPDVDIVEKDKEFLISIDIPGVNQKDVSIELKDNDLIISGKKETFLEENEESIYHSERSYGEFKRIITLPSNIKEESISANFKDGVLQINMRKEEIKEAKKKLIKIN